MRERRKVIRKKKVTAMGAVCLYTRVGFSNFNFFNLLLLLLFLGVVE